MITFRRFDHERDLPEIRRWWAGHGALEVPVEILPDGWVAESAGVAIAASFLYVAAGKIAVIEWTTTNPSVASGPDKVVAVKGLYEKLESEARDAGCRAVISFVDPDSWERRTMVKMGYVTSQGRPHVLFAKSLLFEHTGGTV